jgi:hypothetical protein
MSEEVRQFTIAHDDDDIRLDRWFKRHLPQVGFATVSRWARTGQIRVDGKRADVDTRLTKGQVLRVPPGGTIPLAWQARPRKPLTEEQIALAESMVLEKDRAAIVLNKPPALPRRAAAARTSMSTGCSMPTPRTRAAPAPGPPARQGHLGRPPDRPHARQRGVLLQALLRPVGQEDLLGAGDRHSRHLGRVDRTAAGQAAGHRRREDDGR